MYKQKFLYTLTLTLIGTFCYALTVKLFLEPSGLVTGGTTGIGLALHRTLGWSLSGTVLAIDGLLLLWALFDLGKKFVAQTIVSTLAYPFCLEIIDIFLQGKVLSNDLLLCTIFSALGVGISLGIVLHAGASTGGTDIPPLSLQKHFGLPVALTINALDLVIILAQGIFMPIENVLYGIVLAIAYSVILDRVLMLGQIKTQVTIISKHAEAIREKILHELDHGVTVYYGEGGLLREKQDILITIVGNRDLPKLERTIEEIDSESFVTVSRINIVKGRGFSLMKKYEQVNA